MIPGLVEARKIEGIIRANGIPDVQLFFDAQIKIWCVVQVMKRTGRILLPDSYKQDDIKPHIMFWIKTNDGKFRLPNEQDASDIIAIVKRSETTFQKGGDWMVEQLDEQSAKDYQKGRQKLTDRIKSVAPELKRAVRKELG